MCPRCSSHVVSDVVHLIDTPDGLHVVTSQPVATHTHTCGCGASYLVASTRPTIHHPNQLHLIQGAVA